MLKALSVAILFPGFLIASCGSPSATGPHSDINPLLVSEAYAKKHYPFKVPKGIERSWHVEDHGDIWIVELSTQGGPGGGIEMGIRKTDGRVLGARITE